MKDYIEQFYNEGLATTFYIRPIKYLEKKIKNKKSLSILCIIIKFFYSILVISFGIYMFLVKWPL